MDQSAGSFYWLVMITEMITDSRGLYDFSETRRDGNPLKPPPDGTQHNWLMIENSPVMKRWFIFRDLSLGVSS
jgi:hypothetical protein